MSLQFLFYIKEEEEETLIEEEIEEEDEEEEGRDELEEGEETGISEVSLTYVIFCRRL